MVTILFTSLNGRSLYFLKFDNTFQKILTVEKVFLDFRIRDLKYSKGKIILALEENGELGILNN